MGQQIFQQLVPIRLEIKSTGADKYAVVAGAKVRWWTMDDTVSNFGGGGGDTAEVIVEGRHGARGMRLRPDN